MTMRTRILTICALAVALTLTSCGGKKTSEEGKDGKLHLLNASSIHKKVVLEPMTLYQYMQKHPVQTGIRVIRLQK